MLVSGFKQGILQGVKTGLGKSRMKSGLLGGIKENVSMYTKMTDPTLVRGTDAPLLVWHADTCTYNASTFAVTALADQSGNARNASLVGTSTFVPNGINNGRGYISTIAGSGFSYSNLLTGLTEYTAIMVARGRTTSTNRLFSHENSVSTTTGDHFVGVKIAPFRFTASQIGNPTTTSVVYDTAGVVYENNWCLVTAKFRLATPSGYGNSMRLFVNGNEQVDALTTSVTYAANSAYTNATFYVCNSTSTTTGGTSFGSIAIFPYWLNESDQILYENYFRT